MSLESIILLCVHAVVFIIVRKRIKKEVLFLRKDNARLSIANDKLSAEKENLKKHLLSS
ncbi:MAG: hypothetical protein MK066_13540 [Crocinitomicaceae bacterium]|nr:hypothetical protein [Crocinitomicaceae bacterium]